MEKFASDFYAFGADTDGRLALALRRWKTFTQAPNPKDVHPSFQLGGAKALIGSLEIAIRDLRMAHAALTPYVPPNTSIGDGKKAVF